MDKDFSRLGLAADRAFLRVEVLTYLIVGIAFAAVAILGVARAAISIWDAVRQFGEAEEIVLAIDRLLLVLMVAEILHTVRASFRSGSLVCEPFLVVGLIASIRRILVITLESSQASQPGKLNPETQQFFTATMMELGVLAALILVMVVSIYILRRSEWMGRTKEPVSG
jgi:uncharacterized membrane protein (DUF373 family)